MFGFLKKKKRGINPEIIIEDPIDEGDEDITVVDADPMGVIADITFLPVFDEVTQELLDEVTETYIDGSPRPDSVLHVEDYRFSPKTIRTLVSYEGEPIIFYEHRGISSVLFYYYLTDGQYLVSHAFLEEVKDVERGLISPFRLFYSKMLMKFTYKSITCIDINELPAYIIESLMTKVITCPYLELPDDSSLY